jgi:hypothetical protein
MTAASAMEPWSAGFVTKLYGKQMLFYSLAAQKMFIFPERFL